MSPVQPDAKLQAALSYVTSLSPENRERLRAGPLDLWVRVALAIYAANDHPVESNAPTKRRFRGRWLM